MKNIIIRKARKEDVDRIYELIKQLASFEGEENAVKISPEELAKDGFGDQAFYKCIVAEKENEVIAFALYYIRYSTWKGKSVYLEDFLVDEKFRSKGVGKLLFEEIIKISKEMGVRQLNWQVLDWNEGAIRFYEKYKANFSNEWINCYILFE